MYYINDSEKVVCIDKKSHCHIQRKKLYKTKENAMHDFLYENFIDQQCTTYDEAKSSSCKTPIDYESLDPLEAADLEDGVFDNTHYLTERDRW